MTTLHPNLNRIIRCHLSFFWNFSSYFCYFQRPLVYFTEIYKCVTRSDVLKSLFNVEMNIRYSKIAVWMLYIKDVIQLHNKNMTINVWFSSRLNLFSVTHSFVTDNIKHFNKVPSTISEYVLWRLVCISFLHGGNILVETSPYSSLTVPSFRGKKLKWEYKKLIFNNILHPIVLYEFNKSTTISL